MSKNNPEIMSNRVANGGCLLILLIIAAVIGGYYVKFLYHRSDMYSEAQSLYAQHDYREASNKFFLLGDYKDSSELYKKSLYNLAQKYLDGNNFNEAIKTFQSLEDYQDSPEKIKECKYRQADRLLSFKDYEAAKNIFESLGDYRDSAAKIQDILQVKYSDSKQLMAQNNNAAAYEILDTMRDYKDSSALLEKISAQEYAKAKAAINSKRYAEAMRSLIIIGDYKDSYLLGNKCSLPALKEILPHAQPGDLLMFGNWKNAPIVWLVLEKNDKKLFLLSRDSVESKPWDDKDERRWIVSEIREWLNKEFYETAFAAAERPLLKQTDIVSAYPRYEEDNSREFRNDIKDRDEPITSLDKVFLLSLNEADKYCPKEYRVSKLINKKTKKMEPFAWWLRDTSLSYDIFMIDAEGYQHRKGPRNVGGIRPAIKIEVR